MDYIVQRKSTGTKWCDVATLRSRNDFNAWVEKNREAGQVYRLVDVIDIDWEE